MKAMLGILKLPFLMKIPKISPYLSGIFMITYRDLEIIAIQGNKKSVQFFQNHQSI